ncbi:XRE family transcriptional regulator [Actinomadura craniellae]|uniref:XRE family transcriptional regulator n=1 Tax=Actinomadura craniellae TaxID=2231787 RepID=A0A365H7D8_9ACTN|nr:XRE family transcriptional regulator [Actinomadura craniellae]RAY14991.1 XRE family transcriptional regulator [Actinomadura craniellae]
MAPTPRQAAPAVPPSATLADKIEWLIQNLWPPTAPPPKNNVEVAAAITAATGEDISSTTIWKLRTGRQDNPQLRTLTALAAFFAVPLGYFGTEAETAALDDDLTLQALRHALDASTLRPDVLRALIDIPADIRWLIDDMIITAASGRGA